MRAALLALALALPARADTLQDLVVGARANAVGGAGALADDPLALFHNPAGLAALDAAAVAGGLGRVTHPAGALTSLTAAYAMPWTEGLRGTAGLGLSVLRQGDLFRRNALAASFARSGALPPLTGSLRWGAGLKVLTLDVAGRSKTAAGVDAGAQWAPRPGLRFGASVLDLVTGTPLDTPAWRLGGAFDPRSDLTLAGELRMRQGLAVFYPGVEWHLQGGLLDLRAAKGVDPAGGGTAVLGLGVNLHPLVVDAAMGFPWEGGSSQSGAYELTASWRFGGEPFTTKYLGRMSALARGLDERVRSLEERRAALLRETAEAEQARAAAQRDLVDMQATLEAERLHQQMEEQRKAAPEPAAGPLPPPAPKPPAWPKRHKVRAGDTLRSVASQYYGDPAQWERIYEANKDRIDRGLPEVGSELLIPAPK